MSQADSPQWRQYDENLRADNTAQWFMAWAWHMEQQVKALDEEP